MTRFTAIDLSGLPSPAVVQPPDFAALVAQRKADVVARVRAIDPDIADSLEATLAIEGELITKLIESGAYRQTLHYQRVNDAARAVMLAFAVGTDLERLGDYYGVSRMIVTPATDTAPAVYESDARLRARIQLAPEAFSTAGPRGAYVFHTLAVDASIKAVGLDKLPGGQVFVLPLTNVGDGTPTSDLLNRVRQRLGEDSVRPLTDVVQVLAPTVINYTIEAEIFVAQGPDANVVRATATARLARYAADRHVPGLPVNVSALIAAAHVPGVERVEIASPTADIEPGPRGVAYATAVDVTATAAGL
jgi:phage-related baseplate assembly protein